MSDSGHEVDTGTLQSRLPSNWSIETVCESNEAENCADRTQVRGYADSGGSGPREKAEGRSAAFEIRQDGELWTAVWLDRLGPSAGRTADHRVTGIKERCVEWVVERARSTEEVDDG